METVNHPPHYNSGGIEVIDVIERWGLGFELGNALKYICRAGRKSDDLRQDLKKALWYIRRAIDSEEIISLTHIYKPALNLPPLSGEEVAKAFGRSEILTKVIVALKRYSMSYAKEDLKKAEEILNSLIENGAKGE